MNLISCKLIICEDDYLKIESSEDKPEKKLHQLDFQRVNNLPCNFEVLREIFDFVPDVMKITCLKLNNCKLLTLPDCLSFLPLKELDISENAFATLPNCLIDGFSEIKTLKLSTNKLVDINTRPKCCSVICDLDLSSNVLKNIPNWLNESVCANLKLLNLSGNAIGSYLYLDMFKYLDKLIVNNSKIMSLNIIYSISGLKKLSIGNITNVELNSFKTVVFNNFSSSNTLLELDLTGLFLSKISDDLNSLINLEILKLPGNYLNELPDIKSMNLKILDISFNDFFEIHDLPETLQELYVHNNSLSTLKNLEMLKDLKVFDAYNNYISDPPFSVMKNIEEIDLEQNCFSTNDFDQNYIDQKIRLRKRHNVLRYNGEKIQSERESSLSRSLSYESDEEYVNNFVCDDLEENWDDHETDDDLILEPLQIVRKVKGNNCNNIFADLSIYDDAPNDNSDVFFT